jgi:hypothetical protein
VLSADVSALGLARQQFADPSEHMILPEIAARQLVTGGQAGHDDRFSVVR